MDRTCTLAWFELATAWDVAGRRLREAGADLYAARDVSEEFRLWRGLNGVCGEMAAARMLGVYWSGSVNTYHAADLGRDIQVRTRTGDGDDLVVRPKDPMEHRYVLVTGRLPDFRLVGWCYGYEAEEWGVQGLSGNRPVWYVPQPRLRPVEALA